MLLFLDSYSDMVLPCCLGIQDSVMQGVHEHRVDTYRFYVPELWMQKKDVEHLTWFSQFRKWWSMNTQLELNGIFNLSASILEKSGQLLQMCGILQRNTDPGS